MASRVSLTHTIRGKNGFIVLQQNIKHFIYLEWVPEHKGEVGAFLVNRKIARHRGETHEQLNELQQGLLRVVVAVKKTVKQSAQLILAKR